MTWFQDEHYRCALTQPGDATRGMLMPTLLDTRTVPPRDRIEAIRTGLTAASKPSGIQISRDAEAIIDVTWLAPSVKLIQVDFRAEWFRQWRNQPQTGDPDGERFSTGVHHGDFCLTRSNDVDVDAPARLHPVDITSSYEIVKRGHCRTLVCEVDYSRLGLAIDVVRAAMARLHTSPVSSLLIRHLLDLAGVAPQLGEPERLAVASATVDLMRAALLSRSSSADHRRAAFAETLMLRIEHYIDTHLADPELTPAKIAALHGLSLRSLYVLLAERAETPAEWILSKRLAAARLDLINRHGTVATIARRWGFKDQSHFSRRFKAAYGTTPAANSINGAQDPRPAGQ